MARRVMRWPEGSPGAADMPLLLAILIAFGLCYTALELAERLRASPDAPFQPQSQPQGQPVGPSADPPGEAGSGPAGDPWARRVWYATISGTLGLGLWSMMVVPTLLSLPDGLPDIRLLPATLSLALPLLAALPGVALALGHPATPGVDGPGWREAWRPLGGALLLGAGLLAGCRLNSLALSTLPPDDAPRTLFPAWLIATAGLALLFHLARRSPRESPLRFLLAMPPAFCLALVHPVMEAHLSHWLDFVMLRELGEAMPGLLAAMLVAGTLLLLGVVLTFCFLARRISEAAQREAGALRLSEKRLRILYRRSPLPLCVLDGNGAIEQVSDAWLELLGRMRREVLGQPLARFMGPDCARRFADGGWEGVLRQRELRGVAYDFLHRDGGVVHVLLSARVERDASGSTVRILAGLTDITARRQAEEALRQSQRMEALGQIAAGVAHDFNNFLMVVKGNLDIARRDPARAERALCRAGEGADRAAALARRLLAFSRREATVHEKVCLPELLHGMEDLLHRSLAPGMRLETCLPPGLWPVKAEPAELESALLNLVINARDAIAERQPGRTLPRGLVRIRLMNRPAPNASGTDQAMAGDMVAIEVADNGQGMAPEVLAHATEPFFTTKPAGRGTGLGLAMARRFAEGCGGRLTIDSRPGEGTTVRILLPRCEEPALPPMLLPGAPSGTADFQGRAEAPQKIPPGP